MNLKRDWHKNPGNDNFNYDEEHKPLPLWFIIMMLCGLIYISYACFVWGEGDGNAEARERIIQAHLEAMKRPLMDSQPSDFYTVWALTDERVDFSNKGAKQ